MAIKPLLSGPGAKPGFGVLQRKCACGGSGGTGGECEECKQKEMSLQKASAAVGPRADGGVRPTVPPIVHEVLGSPGRPLDAATRAFMEPRFGHDFSKVRVHSDERAAESARAVNALAYTVGDHVAFGAGQYAPGSGAGRKLLTHELVHVVQQSRAGSGIPPYAENSLERDADRAAGLVEQDLPVEIAGGSQVQKAKP
jgi:hypothetical protein